jgi:NTP pyrophosphatase (non-canonical NTP hydrolase)
MSKQLVDVHALSLELKKFADDREWEKFHTPKNLVMALTGEVGELNEIFQWLNDSESKLVSSDPKTAQSVRHEIADVFLYLVRLSDILGIDLNDAVTEKIKANAIKYPAESVRGSAKKYNT